MRRWSRLILIVALLLCAFVFVIPALAQDPTGAGGAITTPSGAQALVEALFGLLLKTITDATALPFAVGFVVLMTAISKKLLPNLSAAVIALTWQVLTWAAYVAALHFGYGDQFKTVLDAATTVIGALAGVAFGSLGASYIYNKSVEHNVPLIGDKRK